MYIPTIRYTYPSLIGICMYVCMYVRSISYSRRMLCGISEWLILPPPPPPPRFYLISEITFSSYSIRRRHPFFFYHWPCLGYRAAAAVVVFWLSTIIKIYCVLSGLSKMAGSDINEPASQPASRRCSKLLPPPLSPTFWSPFECIHVSLYSYVWGGQWCSSSTMHICFLFAINPCAQKWHRSEHGRLARPCPANM